MNVPLTPGKAARMSGAILTGIALLLLATPVSAGSLSRDLAALDLVAGPEGEVDVIISYSRRPAEDHRGRLRGNGATGVRDLALIDGLAARVPAGKLRRLADDPDVVRISWDETVHVSTDVAVPAVGGFLARQILALDGTGVRVAIVDSGIEPVADLGADGERSQGRIVAWVDLVEPGRRGPADPYGHGTHVAGIVASAEHEIHEPGARAVYGGMAPGVELVSVRVLDRNGEGRASDVIAGIEWVVAHRDELGIRVLNLSLGHPVREPADEDPLVRACERAWDAGIVVVVSAGNHGRDDVPYGTVTSPGNAPSVLTVGALADRDTVSRADDLVATYSSRGPTKFDGILKPDLLAPGDAIVSLRSPHSTLDRLFRDNRAGSDDRGAATPELFVLSGTSMSAAVVSGAAALLLAADPSLTPDTLKARLMRSAEKRDEDLYARGAGAVDVVAALDDPGLADDARSPRARREASRVELQGIEDWAGDGWSWDEVYGPAALWDESLVWDIASVWEGAPEQVDQVLWQVPLPGEQRASSVIWQIGGPIGTDSVIWQIAGPVGSESVIWQIAGPVGSESVIWQRDGIVGGESVIWQSSRGGRSSSDGDVSAESVIWQRGGELTDILVNGDGGGGR